MRIFSPGREGCTGVRLSCWAQLAILPREINYNMDKFNLVVRAARELTRAVQENYYGLSDLNNINYSEVCEWCNFPDLQDGGIYEQAIDAAAKIIIEIIK